MMKPACTGVVLGSLLAVPVFADPMTQDQCDRSWRAFVDVLEPEGEDLSIEQSLTQLGWCAIKGGEGVAKEAKFQEFRWRADGVETAIANRVPPTKFQVEIDGVDLADFFNQTDAASVVVKSGTIALTVTHDPEIRRGLLEEFKLDLGGLGEVSVLASARNINFRDHNSMLISLGSARLEEVQFEFRNKGYVEQAVVPAHHLGVEGLKEFIYQFATTLPPETWVGDSQHALEALSRALPEADGTLRIIARSDLGLGLPQIAMSIVHFENQNPPVSVSNDSALAFLLDGVELEVSWTPQE